MAETLTTQQQPQDIAPERSERQVIGLASATEREPNSSERFSFWLREGIIVNPFDIVEVEQVAHDGQSRTYGLVLTLEHYTDASSHLANYISNNFGEIPEAEQFGAQTPRQGVTVAKVAVLSNNRDIYMPVANEARVWFATEQGILEGLGITEESMPTDHRIPAGILQMSNGTQAVVYCDERFLLGPEGAHVNITGISGLATKTSYAMFLIQSILQTLERRNRGDEVAVIVLNVKQDDLLHLHREQEALPPEHVEMWERMGLRPRPFPADRIHYFLPHGMNTPTEYRPNSLVYPDIHYETGVDWQIYAYALPDTFDKLDLLLSQVPDPWDTVAAFVGEVMKGLGDPLTGRFNPTGPWTKVRTWNDLLNGEPLVKNGQAQAVGDLRAETVRRCRRILRRIVETRQSGLFVQNRAKNVVCLSEELAQKLKGGHLFVVDIFKLTDDEQTLVFGDILRTLYRLYAEEERDDLPKKVIVFVDELNKYAPKRPQESPIAQQVLDIAERGRSWGIILFGAQQFASAVHPRVYGNCATHVIGRTGSAELTEDPYRFLDPAIRMSVTRFGKGELLLSHSPFRQPIKIRFPLPAFYQPGH